MTDSNEPKNLNSDDRSTRARQLQGFARPIQGTKEWNAYNQNMNRAWNDPRLRVVLKEMHQKTKATLEAQQQSGAGYASDSALRELQLDYNHRLLKHGATYLPTSFSIAEAFFMRKRECAGLFLLPEADFLISFTDFLDYVTSSDSPELDIGAASTLKPNTIINVNSLDVPGSLLLDTDNGHSFSFLGASYVRRGSELSMLLVVGEQLPETELERVETSLAGPVIPAPHKPDLSLQSNQDVEAVYVDNERRLVRGIVLCRFDLNKKQVEARCLLRDMGSRYSVLTDIADTLVATDDPERWASAMGKNLDEVSVIWETAKMLLLLPAYLDARVTLRKVEQRTTKLGIQMQNSLKFKRSVAEAFPEAKVIFRRISAIRVENPSSPLQVSGRSYTPPLFQVQVSGFWRMFSDLTKTGHDEQGNPIQGKTWVRSHIRHKDKSAEPGPKVVYIKASLSQARRKLEQYRQHSVQPETTVEAQRSETATRTSNQNDEFGTQQPTETGPSESLAGAYVYVLRCPAHGKDIYKIGYTDRDPEDRARELSRATAAPTRFLVVQAWAVSDGRVAERAAHEALTTFSVDKSREFFQAPYSTLREGLEKSIQPWLL